MEESNTTAEPAQDTPKEIDQTSQEETKKSPDLEKAKSNEESLGPAEKTKTRKRANTASRGKKESKGGDEETKVQKVEAESPGIYSGGGATRA